MNRPTHPTMLRSARNATAAVMPIELFFDLVYVFAITQLSSFLVSHQTVDGAVQTGVLLAMVWQVWIYTTWAVNFVDPHLQSIRLMMLTLMFASLLFAVGLDEAFTERGGLVVGMYLAMQIGRCLFMLWALRGEELLPTFQRVLAWIVVSGAVMLLGLLVHGHAREAWWATSVAIDLIAAAFGFWIPGIGRSATAEWTVAGGHFAERCQAFVLIALGESIVIAGSSVVHAPLDGTRTAGIVVVFVGSAALWWLYFDRAAADSAAKIAASSDPGAMARNAFHWIHPLIVGGILVSAAADHVVLESPTHDVTTPTAWLVLGGVGMFLGGHALFKAVVWRVVPTSRLVGIAVLVALAPVAPHVNRLTLAACALAVVIGIGLADFVLHNRLDALDETRSADDELVDFDEVDGSA